jgi:hypothetical protein
MTTARPIEQVLFTAPGAGQSPATVWQLLFSATAASWPLPQFLQGALRQWLGDLILVEAVQVDSHDEVLTVTVQYVVRRNLRKQVAQFTQPGGQG